MRPAPRCIAHRRPKTLLEVGDTTELEVDTTDLQIFDADTGLTLRRA